MKKENLSITETFALALQHHERNELQVAEQLYKQILNKRKECINWWNQYLSDHKNFIREKLKE